jgi:hypothetical protein
MPKDQYPVVLRFASLYPNQLSKIQMHAHRTGGPLEHVSAEFAERNKTFVGKTFAAEIRAELRAMAKANLEQELAALKARKRKKEAEARASEGQRDPWHGNSGGPLREVILTAHVDHFRAEEGAREEDILVTHGIAADGSTRTNRLCRKKVEAFEARGREFFDTHFPGAVRHLRLDLDEEAPHFHAVLMQTHEKTTKSRGRQVLVKQSANPLLKDYEHAQDVAGEFFAPLGLVRGETRKRNRQEAKEAGLPLPDSLRHTSPRAFREARLAAIREAEDKARGLLAEAEVTSQEAEGNRTAALQEAAGIREAAQTDAKRIETDAEATAARKIEMAEEQADAIVAAIDHGLEALLAGQIEYAARADGEGKSDTLRRGPAAPTGNAFNTLVDMIRPAGRRLVRLAKKVAELRDRARTLDAREDAVTRDAALLDDTARRLGDAPDPRLRRLAARPQAVGYAPEEYPGAWAVRSDSADCETVQRALDGMTNVQLRRTLIATRDGVDLTEDNPALKSDLGRAARLLEFAAAQRGYDPDRDVHDPKTATDDTRATMHTDTDHNRIQMVRRQRERQRVR